MPINDLVNGIKKYTKIYKKRGIKWEENELVKCAIPDFIETT